MKDYYKIMDISYDAAQADIREAYRRLAKKYHPDVNPGNDGAAARFIEIQEAYFILSDEERRQKFHLRSNYPIAGQKKTAEETPETILGKAIKLNRLLKEIDTFRMNAALFSQAILLLLSDKNILVVNRQGNEQVNRQIVNEILQVCKVVPYKDTIQIANKLLLISGKDETLHQSIYQSINQKRIKSLWEKYNIVIIVFITLMICLLILLLSD